MTNLEQTSLLEILETRRADVLAFIRYLKLSVLTELEERFDNALKSIRAARENKAESIP
jgi:hypothetical protein